MTTFERGDRVLVRGRYPGTVLSADMGRYPFVRVRTADGYAASYRPAEIQPACSHCDEPIPCASDRLCETCNEDAEREQLMLSQFEDFGRDGRLESDLAPLAH